MSGMTPEKWLSEDRDETHSNPLLDSMAQTFQRCLGIAQKKNADYAAGSDPFDCDTDGDGLTDGEEVHAHGTSPVKRDSDGDGQDDAAEQAAGTDPMDPQSRFAAAMGPVVPGVSASVHWNGVAGRNYRVVRSQELGTLNVDFLKVGLAGVTGPMTYEDPSPPPLKAFYWIEVE